MKLATTTNDFDRFCPTYTERLQNVCQAGFRYVDLSLYTAAPGDALLISEDWREEVNRLQEVADRLGATFVQAHSPGGNALGPDPAKRDLLLRRTIRSIEVCAALGIPHTVVHAGFEKFIGKEEFFEKNKAFFEQLYPVIEKTGVNVLVENGTRVNMGPNGEYFYTGQDMVDFLRYLDHPQIHACWDTGHANAEGSQYDEILAMRKELCALHVNDNREKQDEHLIPYFGTLNLDDLMHGLIDSGYRGYFTFECGSVLRSSKYWLGNRHSFEADTRLAEPTLSMQQRLEALLYEIGVHILTTYECLEQ